MAQTLSPEKSASFWSRLYFRWVRPTLDEGVARPLSTDTLLPLNEAENSWRCWAEFAAALGRHRAAVRPVLRAMVELHKAAVARVFAISLIHVTASVASPLLLRRLLQLLSRDHHDSAVMWLVGALFCSALTTSMTAHHMFHVLLKMMIRVRTGLIAAIFHKALALTVASRQQANAGQIINLMGTDAQKFVNVLNVMHSIWMHPIQITVVLTALYWILGPAALAGAAVLAVFLGFSALVSRKFLKARGELIRYSDQRVGLMNEILMSIRVIKFYAWEQSFTQTVRAIRDKEASVLARLAYLSAISTLLFLSTPIVVSLATFGTFVMSGKPLNAPDVFSALALFTVLRHAMVTLPDVVTACLEANVAIRRIEDFLALPELAQRMPSTLPVGTILAKAATIEWTPGLVAVDQLDLAIAPGELVVVVGSVGAGKSALINALLGDLNVSQGRLEVSGSIAYVSQQPWILNATIQDNIVFGLKFDKQRYESTLDACALRQDLSQFPARDLTEIGERGVNLSGGQRQRISLARALYARSDIIVLDDPLSALDNRVGQKVFESCIVQALGRATRVLTTHRLEYVDRADRVLVMEDGRVIAQGTAAALRQKCLKFRELWHAYERGLDTEPESANPYLNADSSAVVTESVALVDASIVVETPPEGVVPVMDLSAARIMTDEERNTGVVGLAVYKRYIREFSPGILGLGLLLLFTLKESFNVATDSWLAYWSSVNALATWKFMGGFAALGLLTCIATYWRSLVTALNGLKAGTNLHHGLLSSVMRAPLSFFEGTPVGRVLNRFSRDMEAIDQQIPRSLLEALGCVFTILSTLAVVIVVSPWAILAVAPIATMYWRVQRRFRPASREAQRLDSVTRSPIFALFSQALAGVPVIRAFAAADRFEHELLKVVESNSRAFYTIISANRWLGTRIETLGAGIVATAATAGVFYGGLHIGFAGLAVTYALAITGALNWAVRMFSQVESNLNSVERVDFYMQLPAERWSGLAPSPEWPQRGQITFVDFELRYRPELSPAIRGFSAVIRPGEKIGVVGRTGAGKSTLLLGIFRLVEAAAGRIEIDGVDIATLDLAQLRSRIAIIPQEPVVFSGSVRKNLDPFASYRDDQLWDALRRAELDVVFKNLPQGLDTQVHEGGSNFSVGQRQLLCLARAILKRSKILLLDEATASVDVATDELIQQAIRSEFADSTVITIAHRINTVMDCDRIMVLDSGRLVEFDRPSTLLRRKGSYFANLVQEENHKQLSE